jgi:hypothetical protein
VLSDVSFGAGKFDNRRVLIKFRFLSVTELLVVSICISPLNDFHMLEEHLYFFRMRTVNRVCSECLNVDVIWSDYFTGNNFLRSPI